MYIYLHMILTKFQNISNFYVYNSALDPTDLKFLKFVNISHTLFQTVEVTLL